MFHRTNMSHWVRIQVLTAASTKMSVFWDVAPFRLIKLIDVSYEVTASFIRAII
jgi:hypothetical protein